MSSDDDALLTEQQAYYRAAAAEYDRPIRSVRSCGGCRPWSRIFRPATMCWNWPAEPASGTVGLAARARSVTAVDAAAEVPAVARARVPFPNVRFLQADLFTWRPSRRYDTVFFAFWLSHIPHSADTIVRVLEHRRRHARAGR
ncbi:class I SAM-dependent methyltransferase [Streptomyces sp. NPDC001100]